MLRPETPAEEIPLTHREDAELAQLSTEGHQEAFEVLWARHRETALRVVSPLAKSDAEDAVAEAYAEIWQQLQRGSAPPQHFKSYLIRVSKNVASKQYRDRQHTVTGLEVETLPEQPLTQSSATIIEGRDQRRLIIAAFVSLPKRWQQVLWLTTVDKLPRRKAASLLDLEPNAVSAIAVRAKEGLRIAWLEQHLPPPERVTHQRIASLLPKYVRRSLSNDNTARVNQHLTSCDPCQTIAEHLRHENQRLRTKRGAAIIITVLTAAAATIRPALPAAATIAALPTTGIVAKVQGFITQGGSTFITAGTAGVVALSVAVGAVLNPDATQDVAPERANPAAPLAPPFEESSAEEPSPQTAETPSGAVPVNIIEPVRDTHASEETLTSTHPRSDAAVTHPSPVPPSPVPLVPPTVDESSAETDNAVIEDEGDAPSELPEVVPEVGPEIDFPFSLHPDPAAKAGVPPFLSGTAPAGSSIHVAVADHSFPVETTVSGEWQVDLAQLLLSAGSHTVTLTLEESSEILTVPLDLTHPTIEFGENSQWAEILGFPNSTVCLWSHHLPGIELTLNDAGVRFLGLIHPHWWSPIVLSYCDGDRRGPAYVIDFWR